MTSFQISVSPSRRAAARFVEGVRRAIQKALAEENQRSGITQSDIARKIGVHRSVINREIRGYKDITLGRVAELAHALGRVPHFDLVVRAQHHGTNVGQPIEQILTESLSGSGTVAVPQRPWSDSKAA
jgi:plasmid maintenance system antidote protein VapI